MRLIAGAKRRGGDPPRRLPAQSAGLQRITKRPSPSGTRLA